MSHRVAGFYICCVVINHLHALRLRLTDVQYRHSIATCDSLLG